MMNCWLSITRSIAAPISAFIPAYSAFRSRNGKNSEVEPCGAEFADWVTDCI